jgi:hypothetical protein
VSVTGGAALTTSIHPNTDTALTKQQRIYACKKEHLISPAPLVSATIPVAIAAAAAAPIPVTGGAAVTASTHSNTSNIQPGHKHTRPKTKRLLKQQLQATDKASRLTCPCRPCHYPCRRRAYPCHQWGCAHARGPHNKHTATPATSGPAEASRREHTTPKTHRLKEAAAASETEYPSSPAPVVSATIPATAAPIPVPGGAALTTSIHPNTDTALTKQQPHTRTSKGASYLTCPSRLCHHPCCHSHCRSRAYPCHQWGCARNKHTATPATSNPGISIFRPKTRLLKQQLQAKDKTARLTCPSHLCHHPCHSRCRRHAYPCHRWGCAHNNHTASQHSQQEHSNASNFWPSQRKQKRACRTQHRHPLDKAASTCHSYKQIKTVNVLTCPCRPCHYPCHRRAYPCPRWGCAHARGPAGCHQLPCCSLVPPDRMAALGRHAPAELQTRQQWQQRQQR